MKNYDLRIGVRNFFTPNKMYEANLLYLNSSLCVILSSAYNFLPHLSQRLKVSSSVVGA